MMRMIKKIKKRFAPESNLDWSELEAPGSEFQHIFDTGSASETLDTLPDTAVAWTGSVDSAHRTVTTEVARSGSSERQAQTAPQAGLEPDMRRRPPRVHRLDGLS